MSVALVTGTSSGIGEATTRALAHRGWHVCATMRDLEKSIPLQRWIAETQPSGRIDIERLDVTDVTSIREAVAAILSRTGNRLDAVVHNAGVAAGGAFEDLPVAEVRRVMETNFFGVLELTRQLLPVFRAQGHGRLVIVSSDAAFAGQPANSIYCASKWALEGWAESLAYELEPFRIAVVLIEPGPYLTDVWKSSPRFMPADSPYARWTRNVSDLVDRHVARNAREPREVADAICSALDVARPRFRYPVGPLAHLNHFLRGKLPASFQRRLTAWHLGMARSP